MSEGERQVLAIRLYDNWQGTDTSDSLEIYCYERGKEDGYNKAIDDFSKLLREIRDNRTLRVNCDDLEIKHMAEQLKAGVKNEN